MSRRVNLTVLNEEDMLESSIGPALEFLEKYVKMDRPTRDDHQKARVCSSLVSNWRRMQSTRQAKNAMNVAIAHGLSYDQQEFAKNLEFVLSADNNEALNLVEEFTKRPHPAAKGLGAGANHKKGGK